MKNKKQKIRLIPEYKPPISGRGDPPLIILIPGFNVRDPFKSVGKLQQPLIELGYRVLVLDYGWVFLIRVWRRSKKAAKFLRKVIGEPFIIIAHSNGANVSELAAKEGCDIYWQIYFSPALNRGMRRKPNVQRRDVFHSRGDRAVWMAKWLPFSSWGDMGAVGYRGLMDDYDHNHDWTKDVPDHSDWWGKVKEKTIRRVSKLLNTPDKLAV